MATISFTLPTSVINFLNLHVSGFADASGGGNTLSLQVPALPAPVVAGLNDAGFQIGQGAAGAAAPVAASDASAAAAPAGAQVGAPIGLAQFAPAGLVPQGEALQDPNLAGANALALNLGQAANNLFEQAVANQAPPSLEQITSFAAQQNQAILDYFGGV